ncbi:MAG: methylenetetrahydromethanopterin dehydrogenase [Methylothermaceae bacteria B42]|nr:MAG: methylenetetrahydromethanopterin dehydrogenase [Methylothermaceae bacteria B42]HHJ39538.1 methylenetetrahydromethanopterin dehydrogenase [Methylothermaceae bacterium]
MEKPYILHMLSTEKNLSPFDVNMAQDAGWQVTMPYLHVKEDEVRGLIQDAIFSRGPAGVKREAAFIGGRDAECAVKMLKIAQESMVPPFEISVLADPSGAFTTAAAMVAAAERELGRKFNTDLSGKVVLILAGTGPVGQIAAVLCAKAGAKVTILGRQKEKSERIAKMVNEFFGEGQTQITGEGNDILPELLPETDVIFATGAAGIQLLTADQVAAAPKLKVAADVNAVPPEGIAGIDAMADGALIAGSPAGAVGIGALAIGNIKYQAHHRLLKLMRETEKPVYLHFDQAFEMAREFVKSKS